MKNLFFPTLIVLALIFWGCSKKENNESVVKPTINSENSLYTYALMGLDSPFISIDSANKMLTSYQNSVQNDPNALKSLIVDADALRFYLQNSEIKRVKLMFAHKLRYIRDGNANINGGYNYKALTVVIAGFDANNNYIYSPQGAVLDFCQPCPTECPPSGTASQQTLPVQ